MYFVTVGLHTVHVGLMVWILKSINAGKVNTENYILHSNIALYWDVVHIIWIFAFSYYYMIGAGGVVNGY